MKTTRVVAPRTGTLVIWRAAVFGLIMLIFGMLPSPVSATLIGDVVNDSYYYPDLSTQIRNGGNEVVSPLANYSFQIGVARVNTTVTSNQISIYVVSPDNAHFFVAPFNGEIISSPSSPNIMGINIDGSTNLAGFTRSDLSFTPTSVSVNLQALQLHAGQQQIVLDLAFPQQVSPASQAANVVTAVGGAYQYVYEDGNAQRYQNTYQEALDCASGTITNCDVDALNQSATQQFENNLSVIHNAGSGSINFVLSTPPDITVPDLLIAGFTGQLTSIASNAVSFLKWLATGRVDPPVSVVSGSATGYYIDVPGLSYNFYDLVTTVAVDPADLSVLLLGDAFLTT